MIHTRDIINTIEYLKATYETSKIFSLFLRNPDVKARKTLKTVDAFCPSRGNTEVRLRLVLLRCFHNKHNCINDFKVHYYLSKNSKIDNPSQSFDENYR